MSQDRDLDETVTVTRGDVTVEKSFEPDQFPVPAVTFDIRSSGDDPIDVRLVDQIPEEFAMSAIGFHPEFESDNWSAYKDHRVVFERVLEPGEQLTTVYGVRLDREEDAVAFLTEPTLEGIDGNDESVDDLLGEDRNRAVRDVLAGDRESLVSDETATGSASSDEGVARSAERSGTTASQDDAPEIELEDPTSDTGTVTATPRAVTDDTDDAIVDASSTVERVDAQSDAGESLSTSDTAESVSTSDTDESASTAASTSNGESTAEHSLDQSSGHDRSVAVETASESGDGIAAALAAEIRDGRVDNDDLDVLRTELDLGVPRSVDVRIQRLQREVSDLNAYTEALEDFIDEEGTAEEFIESFRNDVSDLSATVADLEEDLVRTDDEFENVRSELGDTRNRVEAVDDAVENLRDDVSDVRGDIDELDADVETLRADLNQELDATTAALETTLQDEIETVRTEIDRTADDILEHTASNSDRIETLEDQLSEFEAFRERLEQAFGGMGGVNGGDTDVED